MRESVHYFGSVIFTLFGVSSQHDLCHASAYPDVLLSALFDTCLLRDDLRYDIEEGTQTYSPSLQK